MNAQLEQTSERLKGKVALITGIGAGIGQGCALMFARHGARVFGTDLVGEAAEKTAQQAAADGFPLEATYACDLGDEIQVKSWIASVEAAAGRADILVNAAAHGIMSWIEDMPLADFRHTLRNEIEIVFITCQQVWPLMKRSGGGSIVNFSSANSHMALQGSPAIAHCAGKGGVLAMTHQIAMEGAPHGIRANSIAPGLVVSAQTSPLLNDPDVAQILRDRHMLKRLGEPADIAWAALYLASDESSWVTAQEFRIDGGVTRW